MFILPETKLFFLKLIRPQKCELMTHSLAIAGVLRGAFATLGAGLVIKSFVSTGRSIEDLNVRLKQLCLCN